MKWTNEEDKFLCQTMLNPPLRDDNKIDWNLISTYFSIRSPKQCRERWTNIVDPSINKNEWTKRDDNSLKILVNMYGRKWKKIASHMNGRNANDIKNRWNGYNKNRSLRKDLSLILQWSHFDIFNTFR